VRLIRLGNGRVTILMEMGHEELRRISSLPPTTTHFHLPASMIILYYHRKKETIPLPDGFDICFTTECLEHPEFHVHSFSPPLLGPSTGKSLQLGSPLEEDITDT